MQKLTMSSLKLYKTFLVGIFSFIIGCMITINLAPIERTCKLDKIDREYNIMSNAKLKSPDLLVLILSAPKNLNKRNTVRNTWLKLYRDDDEKEKMKYYFVIGSLGLSFDEVMHLSSEQSEHHDILLLPINDTYNNLSYKVLKSFVHLKDLTEVSLDFGYVLKCDDDSFVRIDSILHEIAHLEIIYMKSDYKLMNFHEDKSPYVSVNYQIQDTNRKRLYWGYFKGNARVKSKGKWKEDDWILCDYYLPYAQGGGYVLSKELVLYLAKNFDDLKLYNSEDVSIGTWLAPVKNIVRIHDVRFDTEWISRGCQNYHLVIHNLTEKQMSEMYNNLVETGNLCKSEDLKRKYCLYNWTVLPSKSCG